jgi:putative endonuclease
MYYVYILLSAKDNRLYIGYSANLKERVENHLNGKVKVTKNRLPLILVYYEAFINELAARHQELFYKTGQGRRVLKNRLNFLEKYNKKEFKIK